MKARDPSLCTIHTVPTPIPAARSTVILVAEQPIALAVAVTIEAGDQTVVVGAMAGATTN
ncbi:MAG: hypothetical protein HXY51_16225 [Nitrospirae bacterium]|nr:hypothetical protein [Nitrospirota bacterium]